MNFKHVFQIVAFFSSGSLEPENSEVLEGIINRENTLYTNNIKPFEYYFRFINKIKYEK